MAVPQDGTGVRRESGFVYPDVSNLGGRILHAKPRVEGDYPVAGSRRSSAQVLRLRSFPSLRPFTCYR